MASTQAEANSDDVAVTRAVTMEDILRIVYSLASEVNDLKNEFLIEKGSSSPAPSDPRRSSIYVQRPPISSTLQPDLDNAVLPAVLHAQKVVCAGFPKRKPF